MRSLLSDFCLAVARYAHARRWRRTMRVFARLDLVIAGLPQHGGRNGSSS